MVVIERFLFNITLGIVFSGVMPKIIRVLEMLEALVSKREKDLEEVAELNSSLQKLEEESKLKDKKQQEVYINMYRIYR